MIQFKFFLGGFDKNLSYLIWCDVTKKAALIDPSVKPYEILKFLKIKKLNLEKILITHSHTDHLTYLDDFNNILNQKLKTYISNKAKLEYYRLNKVKNNQIINIGKYFIKCLLTPGHYYDSTSFWIQDCKLIFSGDTMFIGRTGRTVSSGSDINDLYDSIYNILLKLPNDTLILPGHHYGYKMFDTIGNNIKNSSFFRCKNFNEFKTVMNNYEKSRK
tara:strand:- start:275 stop:925 length:651 start_codon:yes stop_codon:yes gene_type:complete